MKYPFISRKEHERRLVQEQNAHIEHLHALKAQVTNLESGSPLFWLFAEKNPVITDTMMEQIANIAEVDPQLVDLVRRLMVAQQGYRATLPTEQDRLLAVNEVRLLSWNDPVTERMLTLWTDYGFGLGWFIKPQDDVAELDWSEYYEAARNQPILGEVAQQELSDTVLRDGEFWFVYFVDKLTGLSTVRAILTDEIKEIITDPDDLHIPIYYRREFTRGKNKTGETLYYLDWHLNPNDPDDAKVIAGADIPKDAKLAHEDKLGTYVVAQHVAHRRKGINQLRGWPMPATGSAWARAYKQFLENRAAVARAVASVVDKLVAKGGSQAMDVIQNKFNAALSTTGKYGLTNPPLAGSTWLQNEALDRQRMPLNTGAGDAQIDGGSLLSMAALPAGLPPHLMGRGEVVRMAVAECHDEQTEFLSDRGWLRFDEWEPGIQVAAYDRDQQQVVFTDQVELKAYEYAGEMVHIRSRAMDCFVTPNHRFLTTHNREKTWREVEAGCLSAEFDLPAATCAPVSGERRESYLVPGYTTDVCGLGLTRDYPAQEIEIDTWLAFIAWWTAEGNCEYSKTKSRTNYQVVITLSSEAQEVAEMDALVAKLPWKFSRSENRGYGLYAPRYRWRCSSKQLFLWLRDNIGFGAANKRIPPFVFSLSPVQRKLFLDTLWKGDGHLEKESDIAVGEYGSISEQLADDVQRLVLSVGGWARKRLSYDAGYKGVNSRPFWMVRWTWHESFNFRRRMHVRKEHYEGMVYCFTIPEYGMFLTRRNGYPLIACNSMDDPIYRQFTRYQSFWAGIWKNMVNIVLAMRESFGGAEYKNTKVTVQTDNLRNVKIADIVALSNMVLALHSAELIQGEEADELYSNLVIQLMRMGLLTLGVRDPDALLGLADFEPETITVEALQKKLAALQSNAPAETRVLLHAMQSYLGGAIDYGSTVEFLKDALEEQEG